MLSLTQRAHITNQVALYCALREMLAHSEVTQASKNTKAQVVQVLFISPNDDQASEGLSPVYRLKNLQEEEVVVFWGGALRPQRTS